MNTTLTEAAEGPIILSPTEFGYLSGGTINIGNSNSGIITISSPVTTTSNLNLATPSGMGVIPAAALGSTDLTITGKTLSFTTGTPLNIAIKGLTAKASTNGYSQLKVAGEVNLLGAVLSLSTSTYTPVAGNVFTIVSATSIKGTFNEFAEGAILNFNGVDLKINYTTTTVTLSAFEASTITTQSVSSIGAETATGNGNITNLGDPTPT